jgi:hypothetical protein
MGNPDLTTAIVVGAVVGIFFVALGHAQMVWLARQKRARDPAAPGRSSPLRTLLSWTAALVAALCFLRAATSRALPDRPALLVGEDLLSVRARPGLIARHETGGAEVRRGDPLIRFAGQDGEEAKLAVRSRRQQLAVQLANERMRPLDLDAEIVRQADAARAALRDHDQRLKQLVSERDAIAREVTTQRLGLHGRRFRIEQEERDAVRELDPLVASLATERDALRSAEELLAHGAVSRLEVARERDAVSRLEGRVRQLEEKRAVLAREQRELASLRAAAEETLERQLGARAAELQAERAESEAARAALARATEALEQDRPRAIAERRARLRELEDGLAECDALLDGRGPPLVVQAPWDGRIGFRDPSPEAAPADGGPLLVAYRPGKIVAAVRLEPGETEPEAALDAAVQVAAPGRALGEGALDPLRGQGRLDRAEVLLPGEVVHRALLPDGATELRVACDPPDRVVRQLAMGGTVPVVARLNRTLVSATSFRLGLALAAVALGLMLQGSLRRRAVRRRAAASPGFAARARNQGGAGPSATGWPPQPRQVWPSEAQEPSLPPAAALGPTEAAAAPGGPREL